MGSKYTPKPKVICHSCRDQMIKRRNSKTGRYYCRKTDCQDARRRDWSQERAGERVQELLLERSTREANAAAFVRAALHEPRVRCTSCGLTNAVDGYPHFAANGDPCGGTAYRGAVPGVTMDLALAVWPKDARTYAEVTP